MPNFLASESKGSDFLVLWLDCDKEGENICFEVIECVNESNKLKKSNILRAHFSSITDKDIRFIHQLEPIQSTLYSFRRTICHLFC